MLARLSFQRSMRYQVIYSDYVHAAPQSNDGSEVDSLDVPWERVSSEGGEEVEEEDEDDEDVAWYCSKRRHTKINIETRRSTTPGKRVILVQGPC
ncbi:hypothetical protein C8Q73DRAFT_676714 [Cubamyces lactineus]|nr:hypothetical protein C8Q73DRAFT_676714 [Cubamyces lactineus]